MVFQVLAVHRAQKDRGETLASPDSLESRDPRGRRDRLEPVDLRARSVCREKPGRKVSSVHLASLVAPEHQVIQVRMDSRESRETVAILETLVSRAVVDVLDLLAVMEPLVYRAVRDHKAVSDSQVCRVPEAQTDNRDSLVELDLLVQRDRLEVLVFVVSLATLDWLALRVTLASRVYRETLVLLVLQARRDPEAMSAHRASRVCPDSPVELARVDRRVRRVREEWPERREGLVIQVTRDHADLTDLPASPEPRAPRV